MLVGRVVHGGEDAVGSSGAILVGRMERGIGAQRIDAFQGGGTVKWADIKVRKELMGVAGVAREVDRTGDDRDVPPLLRQHLGQRAGDLGRAAAREKRRPISARGCRCGEW